MPDNTSFFKNSVFTYYMTDADVSVDVLTKKSNIGKWNIYASDKTEVKVLSDENGVTIAIIGYCIDSYMEFSQDAVCSYLALFGKEHFSDAISRLAGKFIIARVDSEGIEVYTDATATLPVFYCQKNDCTHISSLEYFIKENTDCHASQEALHIINKSDGAKTLPGDMSHYKNIYSLLPNHFYSSESDEAVRYGKKGGVLRMSSKEAAEKTAGLICNIARQLTSKYGIKCPLTGGYDSRVVFAALENISYGDPGIYTMKHKMRVSNPDISIPRMIAKDKGYEYILIDDNEASCEYKDFCDYVMGNGLYSARTLDLIYTLKDHLGDSCLLNGDIMGQIGKSSLHRSVKECFMGPRYYQCKVHNTSKYSLKEIKKWYKRAKVYGVKNICDKFSKEIRLGRWAADENNMYSLFGINVINIFNSTDIIDIWECVPRCERKLSILHKELIGLMDNKLLYYSFGAEKISVISLLRKSDLGFYIATFIKFYLQVIKNSVNLK